MILATYGNDALACILRQGWASYQTQLLRRMEMKKSLCSVGIALLLTTLAPAALVGCADDAGQLSADATEAHQLGQFEVFEGVDGQFYFRLVATNGEIVLASEGYTRRGSAEAGIASVKAHGAERENYQVQENRAGDFYFNLVARNQPAMPCASRMATRISATTSAQTPPTT